MNDYKIRSDRNRLRFKISEKTGAVSKEGHDGRVTFTVTSLQDSTARFEVVGRPAMDAHPPADHPEGEEWSWVTLVGDEEHTFEQDATHDVVADVHVHAGMPEGSRELWLSIADVDHPQEIYAEGPDPHVDVVIESKKPPIPWWVWLLIGIAVAGIVLGIVLWQVLQKGLGDECDEGDSCKGDNVVCSQGRCRGREYYEGCTSEADCVTRYCDKSTRSCVKAAAGDDCGIDGTCPSNMVCEADKCRLNEGEQCNFHHECASGYCDSRGHACDTIQVGEPCTEGLGCGDGTGLTCEADGHGGRKCLYELGELCQNTSQCADGDCVGSPKRCKLTAKQGLGAVCETNDSCQIASGLVCTRVHTGVNDIKVCLYKEKRKCGDDAECASQWCAQLSNRRGRACKRNDGMCATDADCFSGFKCSYPSSAESGSRTCRLPKGAKCRGKPRFARFGRTPIGDPESFEKEGPFLVSGADLCQPDTHRCSVEGTCGPNVKMGKSCREYRDGAQRPCASDKTCVSGSCKTIADWKQIYWKEFLKLNPYKKVSPR